MVAIPRGLRYMATGAFFFSIMSLMAKTAGDRIPTQEMVLARGAVMTALSYLALRRAGVSPWGERQRGLLLLRGVMGFTALSCFFFAVVRLPLADATVIHFTAPVFTGIIAALVLRESVGGKEIGLALLSLIGVLMIARPGFLFGDSAAPLNAVAVGVGMLGAIFSAGAYVSVRKLGQTEPALVIIFWFSLVTMAGSTPGAILTWVSPTPMEWLILVGIGVATQIAQVFLTHGLRLERAGKAIAVGYLQVVFAAGWGFLVFREIPTGWTVVGALVIIASTFLLTQIRTPAEEAPQEPSPRRVVGTLGEHSVPRTPFRSGF